MSKTEITPLRRLYKQNRVVAAILDHFAARTNNQWVTKVDVIFGHLAKLREPPSRGEVIEALRALGELGFGEFKTGRRGHPSRFEWAYRSSEVGRASAGDEEAEICVVPDEERKDDEDAVLKEHRFVLRRDMEVTFSLPIDLNTQEAERLAIFLRALPIV